jgi:hypothetical protein
MPEYDVMPGARLGRSSAPALPRRTPPMLRLQRAIGNRATARLLRQATATEDEVRADVEAERARFEQARTQHERRLKEIDALDRPHVLKAAGVKTDSQVNDKTPGLIQAALAESRLLRPYLRGKFPALPITGGKFEIHPFDKDFNRAAGAWRRLPPHMTDLQLEQTFKDIGGYYDRGKKTIHLRPHATFGHAVHESMHKISHAGFLWWGSFIDEGVTQLFADRLLEEHGLSKVTNHSYGPQLACAEKLVRATNLDMVARAYFLNDGELRETLRTRFNLTLHQMVLEIQAEKFCARL